MILALATLVVTIGVETTLAVLLSRLRLLQALPRRLLIDVPLVNLITHPAATFAVRNAIASFAAVELLVFVVEVLLYRTATGLKWLEALALASVANGVTLLLSLVL